MIFEETLNQYNSYVKEAVEELFLNSYTNQQHDTDLLLILQNGLKKNIQKKY
jgi:hypothetical protein